MICRRYIFSISLYLNGIAFVDKKNQVEFHY